MFWRSKSEDGGTPEANFWSWFQRNEARLFDLEQDLEQIFDELSAAMQNVNADLTFEFSPVREDGKREFVISAGGIKAAFPAVEALYEAAPTLNRWQWVKFRPRQSERTDITFGERTIPFEEVHYLMAKDYDKIGIVLFFDGYSEEERSVFGNIGYLYLDQVLGEYAVETQIGFIEFHSRESQYFIQARPLSDLQSHFDEQRPRTPH